ncbi:MAG: helix-turn-helix domain-containing protein [Marivita sp.]|jgi:excisionase family DNA binding protein
MFSPQQAANKAGVSRKTVMNAIENMQLPAHRNNRNHWSIRPTDLANWMRDREKNRPEPTTESSSEIPVIATTQTQELELLKSQLQLSFTQKRLEAAEQANNELRAEVAELKDELRQSRADLNTVWREVTGLLADLAKQKRKPKPLILSEEWRLLDEDEAENLFDD